MALFIIDTDTLTLFRNGHPTVVANILRRPPQDIAASVVTLEEQLTGWYGALRMAKSVDQQEYAYRKLIEVVEFFKGFAIIPLTKNALLNYQVLLKRKLNVGGNDLRIAASALEHAATVVTANIRDFGRIPQLLVEDWTV